MGPAGKPLYKSLYFQVIVAIVIGVLLGHFYPETGTAMKPLGDGFIKLIKMIIAPIIFCTVVVGIAGMEDMKKVGKTGGYALLYFEIVSTIALLVGLTIVNVVQPGAGMNVDPATLDTKAVAAYTKPGQMQSTTEFLLNVIPNTVVDAFAKGEILQVLLFAVLFGFCLHKFGGRGTLVFDFIEKISHVFFAIVGVIMKVAPIGAFGAMAFTIGKYGVGSLLSLGKLMGTFYLTCLVFILVVLGLIARFHGFSILKFIRYIKEELLIVLGTSSSESVLPRMMAKMENLGVKKSTVGLVVPTGYSFNLGCRRRHRQRVHRPGRDTVGGGTRPGGRTGVDPRYRPLHVRGPRADQSYRQWCGHRGRRQMGRRTRHEPDAKGAQQRKCRGSGRTGEDPGRQGRSHGSQGCVGDGES